MAAIRETCEALSTALHAIPFLISFFFCYLFFPAAESHSITTSFSMYPPHALLTYYSQVHRAAAWTLGSSGELN